MQTKQSPDSIYRQFARLMAVFTASTLVSFVPTIEAAKPPQNSIVPLCATVADRAGDALQSDGLGGYCYSGVTAGVQASFGSDGKFYFASGNPGTSGRVALLNVTDCLSNCVLPVPSSGGYQIQLQTMAPTCNGPVVDFRTIPDGGFAYVGMVIRILTPLLATPNAKLQKEWFVVFGDWPDDPDCGALHVKYPCSNGAQAFVTRNGNTWTLEAPATEVCLLEYAPTSKNDHDPFKLRGRISFPFKMTMTLAP